VTVRVICRSALGLALALIVVPAAAADVYFDTVVRERLEPEVASGELPAEIPTPAGG
jgi:hypothetical protein